MQPVCSTFGAAALALGLFAACLPAAAQVARSGGGDSQRAVAQMQQLAQERTALQVENERLKRELEKAKADAASATAAAVAVKGRLAGAEAAAVRTSAANRASETELAEVRARVAELVARYRELADNLRVVESERATLREDVAARSRDYDRCVIANRDLHALTIDVLQRYEEAGFGHAVRRAEPFTRITRTRIENLVDEYRARADELSAAAGAATAGPAAR